MQGVEVGQEATGGDDELVPTELAEEALIGQSGEQLARLGLDPLGESEQRLALRHIDGPHFAGPVVHLTEQVTMQRPEMVEVEVAQDQALSEEHALGRGGQAGLGRGELMGVADPEKVPKYAAAGIDVRVGRHPGRSPR